MRRVIFKLFSLRTSSVGGGGGGAARLIILFYFLFSRPREDWPPYKVVFFGLATNTLNVRNNTNNQKFDFTFDEAKERLNPARDKS